MATWDYIISGEPPDGAGFQWEAHHHYELESEQPFWDVFAEILKISANYRSSNWYYIAWPVYALQCKNGESVLYIVAQMKRKERI